MSSRDRLTAHLLMPWRDYPTSSVPILKHDLAEQFGIRRVTDQIDPPSATTARAAGAVQGSIRAIARTRDRIS